MIKSVLVVGSVVQCVVMVMLVQFLAIRSVWASELVTTLMGTLHQTQTTHILYPQPSWSSSQNLDNFCPRKILFQQKYEAFARLHESKADLTELTILFKLSD